MIESQVSKTEWKVDMQAHITSIYIIMFNVQVCATLFISSEVFFCSQRIEWMLANLKLQKHSYMFSENK